MDITGFQIDAAEINIYLYYLEIFKCWTDITGF